MVCVLCLASGQNNVEVQLSPVSVQGSKDYWRNTLLLAYTSIGIVYGDVGTSPLYVMASVFSDTPTKEEIVGVTSLILWSITALLGIKYALIVLRADDNGQGEGCSALFSAAGLHCLIRPCRLCQHAACKAYLKFSAD